MQAIFRVLEIVKNYNSYDEGRSGSLLLEGWRDVVSLSHIEKKENQEHDKIKYMIGLILIPVLDVEYTLFS